MRTDKKEANIEQPVVAASGVDLTAGEVKELKACASFDNVRYGTLDSKVELVRRSVMYLIYLELQENHALIKRNA